MEAGRSRDGIDEHWQASGRVAVINPAPERRRVKFVGPGELASIADTLRGGMERRAGMDSERVEPPSLDTDTNTYTLG